MSAECPSPGQLSRFRRDELEASEASGVRAHLEMCSICRDRFLDEQNTPIGGAGEPRKREWADPLRPFHLQDDGSGPLFMSTLMPPERRELEGEFVAGQLVFGRYEVVRTLGRGGMGIVYLVRDRKNNNAERSLKMILPDELDERSRKRLRREANVLARLNHPHIVNLIDSEFDNTRQPHIVMEFVKGTSLDKVLRTGVPMPLDWAARILEQLCDALKATHGLDPPIVHRDLKPSNLMLLAGRSVGREFLKVLDFGLAREMPLEGWEAPAKSIDGGLTPPYASPEQCRFGSQDERSDIYSVGVILYEILTGYRPFQGTLLEVIEKHKVERPPVFAARNPGSRVPPEVEAVVFRCLEKDPIQRPQTTEELLHEFLRAVALAGAPEINGSTTVSVEQPEAKETRRGLRRPRWRFVGACATLILTLAVMVGYFRGIWTPVSTPNNEAVMTSILSDILEQPLADRRFQRYFSLNHLRAAGAAPAAMEFHRKALTEAVNLVSTGPAPVAPVSIDPDETLFRVDVRTLGWEKTPFQVVRDDESTGPSPLNRFDLILFEYPYGVVPKSSEVFDRLADDFLALASQVRPVVFVRADWFVAVATKPPLLYDLRGDWDDRSGDSRKPVPGLAPELSAAAQAKREYLEKPVTLTIAAAELGLTDSSSLLRILSNARCVRAGLSPLVKGGTIGRDVWEPGFSVAVSSLESELPIPPLEGVTQPVVWSVDRNLFLTLMTNKKDNVFRLGDQMTIHVKNDSAQDLSVELVLTKITGRIEAMTDGPIVIAAGGEYQFPAQGDPPLTVKGMTGKERITAFARAGRFLAGSVLRGSDTSDRFVHDEWRDGLEGLKIMNAFGPMKTSIELETRP